MSLAIFLSWWGDDAAAAASCPAFNMKNFGLKTRLVLAVAFLTLLMAVIALIGYKGISDAERSMEGTYAE